MKHNLRVKAGIEARIFWELQGVSVWLAAMSLPMKTIVGVLYDLRFRKVVGIPDKGGDLDVGPKRP